MSNPTDDDLRRHTFRQSRIPALDALLAFVPEGQEDAAHIRDASARTGFSRWYPVDGGHRLIILYEGGPYDETKFALAPGAWDHEDCKRCGKSLEPMTLCWTTERGLFVLLCDKCHTALGAEPKA